MRPRHARGPSRRRGGGLLPVAALVVGSALVGACGEIFSPDRGTIDDDTFVEVYVDLRVAALRSPGAGLDPDERERILREHGVEEEEVVEFVETHSADIHRMRDIWERVSDRMEEAREAEAPDPPEWELDPDEEEEDPRR